MICYLVQWIILAPGHVLKIRPGVCPSKSHLSSSYNFYPPQARSGTRCHIPSGKEYCQCGRIVQPHHAHGRSLGLSMWSCGRCAHARQLPHQAVDKNAMSAKTEYRSLSSDSHSHPSGTSLGVFSATWMASGNSLLRKPSLLHHQTILPAKPHRPFLQSSRCV